MRKFGIIHETNGDEPLKADDIYPIATCAGLLIAALGTWAWIFKKPPPKGVWLLVAMGLVLPIIHLAKSFSLKISASELELDIQSMREQKAALQREIESKTELAQSIKKKNKDLASQSLTLAAEIREKQEKLVAAKSPRVDCEETAKLAKAISIPTLLKAGFSKDEASKFHIYVYDEFPTLAKHKKEGKAAAASLEDLIKGGSYGPKPAGSDSRKSQGIE
jgi:hypothetical protein